MKTKLLGLLLFLSVTSCIYVSADDEFQPQNSAYTPEFMSRETLEASIALQNAKAITETGKIYAIGDFLFVNEPFEGFHIINNSDPSNPVVEKFLVTPGATDLIFKGNSFYINQAVDLVALRFDASLQNIVETKRIVDAFPPMLSPDGFTANPGEGEIVINWNLN